MESYSLTAQHICKIVLSSIYSRTMCLMKLKIRWFHLILSPPCHKMAYRGFHFLFFNFSYLVSMHFGHRWTVCWNHAVILDIGYLYYRRSMVCISSCTFKYYFRFCFILYLGDKHGTQLTCSLQLACICYYLLSTGETYGLIAQHICRMLWSSLYSWTRFIMKSWNEPPLQF